MRCPFATWRSGPAWKQGYSFYWEAPSLRGLVMHSMEGWRPGAESRLYGPDQASWHFSVYQDGSLEQHYETGSALWHCGYPGNLHFDGIEHEGKDQPLTEPQYQTTLRLTRWYFDQHPEWGAPELRQNLQEHGWLWPTACPSGRIPWARLIADLEEDNVTLQRELEIAREFEGMSGELFKVEEAQREWWAVATASPDHPELQAKPFKEFCRRLTAFTQKHIDWRRADTIP